MGGEYFDFCVRSWVVDEERDIVIGILLLGMCLEGIGFLLVLFSEFMIN